MLNLKILTILLLLGVRVTSWAVEFEQMIKKPSKFHNKRVTLVAMVEGGAVERFYLYQPPEPKSPKDDAREIYGIISTQSPLYERYNKKWVRVTGVIDAEYRGLFAENACSLHIE
jgi:hypothetical protein